MKIWEVIRELEKDSSKKFINEKTGVIIKKNSENAIIYRDLNKIGTVSLTPLFLETEWKEIRKPVDFMTAFKAWYEEGKTIYCEYGCDEKKFNQDKSLSDFKVDGFMIVEGKWYIVD